MTIDDICCSLEKINLFSDKPLTHIQKEIAVRFSFGSSIQELADSYGMTEIGVRKHLDSIRKVLGSVNLTELRVIVFMSIIILIINK
ncbi:helix-turn-helix transcriptional regulator [Proteus mirabilis]